MGTEDGSFSHVLQFQYLAGKVLRVFFLLLPKHYLLILWLVLCLELFCIFTKGDGTHQASPAGPEGLNSQQRLWKVYAGVH